MESKWVAHSTQTPLISQHQVRLLYHLKTALMTWCAIVGFYNVNIIHTKSCWRDAEQWLFLLAVWFRSRVQRGLLHYLCPRRLKKRLWIPHPPMTNWTRPPPSPLWWPQPMRAPQRRTPRSRQTLRFMTLRLVTLCQLTFLQFVMTRFFINWQTPLTRLHANKDTFLLQFSTNNS